MNFSPCINKLRIRTNVGRAILILAVSLGLSFVSLPLFSQGVQGVIQGSVVDQSGGAVAGATVTVIDVARGQTRTLTTDSAGAYVAPGLIPGAYTVRAEAKGFSRVEHPNIDLQVGENVRVDLVLQTGAQTQTITVTSEIPTVNTTDSTLGGDVTNQAINALPMNGRNFQHMTDLRPGIVTELGGGSIGGQSNGLRVGDNLTLIDGLATIASTGGRSILNTAYHQGDATSILPLDAISEFNLEENPKAQYGWRDGAVINVGIKSGTNDIHGTAYAFGRTTSLDASNYFTGAPIPMALTQPGATVGGRILKDKFFWFAGFENLDYTVGDPNTDTIPSMFPSQVASDTTNDLTIFDACTAILAADGTINPLSARLAGLNLATTGCVPQAPSGTQENAFLFNTTAPVNGKALSILPSITTLNNISNGIAKLDYNVTSHNHLSAMFFISKGGGPIQLASYQIEQQWTNNQNLTTEAGNGSWVWTPNSTWVNEARGGYAVSDYLGVTADVKVNPANPWPTGYGLNTGITNPLYGGMPTITIGGFSSDLGQGNHNGVHGPEGTGNFVDNVSYLRGKHAFKFGFEFLEEVDGNNPYMNGNGTISFNDLQSFLTGSPSQASFLYGNVDQNGRMHSWAGFAQDDWRVTPRVTLNLGLRYEYNDPPWEQHNYLGNFNPYVNATTQYAVRQAGGSFPQLYNGDHNDWAPRIGVAWDVKGNGKTVVRAGYAIVYSLLPLGNMIDVSPFGANVPTIGLNQSGTVLNAHNPGLATLTPAQINWSIAGPVFPTNNTLYYDTATRLPLATQAQCTTAGAACQTFTGTSCTPFTSSASAPCEEQATNPNFKTPFSAEWNLDVAHAFTSHLTVEVAYVGNHGYRQPSREDINQPPLGAGWFNSTAALASPLPGGVSPAAYCLESSIDTNLYDHCTRNFTKNSATLTTTAVTAGEQAAQTYQQFLYLQNINETGNLAISNYNGLQATVTDRLSHGLTFLVGYTYSHALDSFTGSVISGPSFYNTYAPNLNYSSGDGDARNRLTLSQTYAIPGLKAPAQMLKGWSVSSIVSLFGGTPWTAADTSSVDMQGTGEFNNAAGSVGQTWNYTGPVSAFNSFAQNRKPQAGVGIPCFGNMSGCTKYVGGVPPTQCLTDAQAPYNGNAQLQQLAVAALYNLGCYVYGAGVLTPPAYGTIGDAGRNFFHGPAYYNVDLSIAKDWKVKERYTAQFRIEFFNLFNRADFSSPGQANPAKGGAFGCGCLTPDATGFTNSVLGAGSPRDIQLGLKLTF
jgi:hypothetical protein